MNTDNKNQVTSPAQSKQVNIKRMVITAIFIALATVLSLIKVYELPLGGSITLLSMLPIAMLSIEYGVKWGFVSAFLFSLIQLALGIGEVMSWGLTPLVLVGSILFDYIFAFTAIGISGIFRKKGITGICLGIALGLAIRFVSHFISGSFLFASWCPEGWNPYIYSICYNGSYMLPEMIFTCIGASVLFKLPQFKKIMSGTDF